MENYGNPFPIVKTKWIAPWRSLENLGNPFSILKTMWITPWRFFWKSWKSMFYYKNNKKRTWFFFGPNSECWKMGQSFKHLSLKSAEKSDRQVLDNPAHVQSQMSVYLFCWVHSGSSWIPESQLKDKPALTQYMNKISNKSAF